MLVLLPRSIAASAETAGEILRKRGHAGHQGDPWAMRLAVAHGFLRVDGCRAKTKSIEQQVGQNKISKSGVTNSGLCKSLPRDRERMMWIIIKSHEHVYSRE